MMRACRLSLTLLIWVSWPSWGSREGTGHQSLSFPGLDLSVYTPRF